MKPTTYQTKALQRIKQGDSLLLVAPTGLGKTFAVTGDLIEQFNKIVYAVPLRALGDDIRRSVLEYKRDGQQINAVIHHGGVQESTLFGEEFIVTTYDQVVCGVPGLPLSLPLKAGHAIAGALLMSRLVFDEAHLAWGISDQALSILLAIVKFRKSFGLQTILMTATLPDAVSQLLCTELGLERILVGEGGEVVEDEALSQRDENRQVTLGLQEIKKGEREKEWNFNPLDNLLKQTGQGQEAANDNDYVVERAYINEHCATIGSADPVKRESCFDVGWLISEEPQDLTVTQHSAYRDTARLNSRYAQSMRSNIYGGVIRANLHRIGTDDHWYLLNQDRNVVKGDKQLRRQKALINAIVNFIASPAGSKTAAWAPHNFLTEGSILLTSARTAPFISPIQVDLQSATSDDDEDRKPVSANRNYRESTQALANGRDTWVWNFDNVQQLIDVGEKAIEQLAGAKESDGKGEDK